MRWSALIVRHDAPANLNVPGLGRLGIDGIRPLVRQRLLQLPQQRGGHTFALQQRAMRRIAPVSP